MSTERGDPLAAASTRIGEARVHKGQRYLCVAVEPYTRKDGAESALLVWESHCKRCDEVFAFRTPNSERFEPNRRCQIHKRRFGPQPMTAPPAPQQEAASTRWSDDTARKQAVPLLNHELLNGEESDLWQAR